jgi:GNAT superfamily N-acetyltransferase
VLTLACSPRQDPDSARSPASSFNEPAYGAEFSGKRAKTRGGGHGARLLAAAEAYALERGCGGAFLDTFSFQARPFYERHGYEVFATLPDFPPGHDRFFLRKRMTRPA